MMGDLGGKRATANLVEAKRINETTARCGTILDAPGTPIADTPAVVFSELLDEIAHAITDHPRSQQQRIGPSEIGEPCSRALIHKLHGDSEPDNGKPNLKAWVGTAVHAELERIFGGSYMQNMAEGPRYLLEQQVNVGVINGVDLTGSCDLFDTLTGTVVDWKTKGKNTLAEHRRHGPGAKYRVQAHCYGLGMVNAGHRVTHVMDVFLPRDGEYRDIIYWAEPFDPQIARNAITRCAGLIALVGAYGLEATLRMYPVCDDRWCPYCATLNLPLLQPAKQLSTHRSA